MIKLEDILHSILDEMWNEIRYFYSISFKAMNKIFFSHLCNKCLSIDYIYKLKGEVWYIDRL